MRMQESFLAMRPRMHEGSILVVRSIGGNTSSKYQTCGNVVKIRYLRYNLVLPCLAASHATSSPPSIMLNKTDFPSYGFMVENAREPSTTLWEKWGMPLPDCLVSIPTCSPSNKPSA